MTLAQIMHLALRQLDEDPADAAEHDDLMRAYANEGYQTVMRECYRPRYTITLETDKNGEISIEGMGVACVAEMRREDGGRVWHVLSADGKRIYTGVKNGELEATVETEHPPLERDTDEPKFPAWAHACLADYICYRHLSSGSVVKQQRALFFERRFWETARRIRPQGEGSVTRIHGLYEATDIRREG